MHELARVTLQNEMDLILAHKRSMKLAELAGLSLSAQTTFATAVSEVARTSIDSGKSGCLILNLLTEQRDRYIVACIKDEDLNVQKNRDGLEYAKRLVNKYHVTTSGSETSIELYYYISPNFKLDIYKIDEWRRLFRNEAPISPYEELKRKNEQLQELSEKVQKSEAQYKTLTNSLPMIIFALDAKGDLMYRNEWLQRYTGETLEALNQTRWKPVVFESDYDAFSLLFGNEIKKGTTTMKIQTRIRNRADGNYLWHQISLSPLRNEQEELQYWIGYMVDIHAQKVFEETLQDNIELKQTQKELKDNQNTLEQYISELNRSNLELQQFAFVASHDLQEPVRKILFYSDYLLNHYKDKVDGKGADYIKSMSSASRRMRSLIQDLLTFSQINKEEIRFGQVDLNNVVKDALQDLELAISDKKANFTIQSLPVIEGDERMMRQLFENIISNSLKYSKTDLSPQIEISCEQLNNSVTISFKDNGIGFDEQYLNQMFTLFQRLHTRESYEGTGLGLAICRKIVDMHRGRMWAEGKEGKGANFMVSLPLNSSAN